MGNFAARWEIGGKLISPPISHRFPHEKRAEGGKYTCKWEIVVRE